MGANRVQVSGHHAYVGGSYAPEIAKGVPSAKGVVIELTEPSRARQVAAVGFSDLRGPNGLTVAGKAWFLAGGQTVEVIDVSEPARPRKLATFKSAVVFPTADDNAHDLVYRDGYLYVTGQSDHRLAILKLEDARIRALATPS